MTATLTAAAWLAPSLFAGCPLPGCGNLVDDPDWPCGECVRIFAGYIRPVPGPAPEPPAPAQAAGVPVAPARAAAAGPRAAAPAAAQGAEYRLNQTCWVCEQRRACRGDPRYPGRLICKTCEQATARPGAS